MELKGVPGEPTLQGDFNITPADETRSLFKIKRYSLAGPEDTECAAMVLPQMDTTQVGNCSSPVKGMLIFVSNTGKLKFYNGTAWETVTSVAD